MCGIASIIRLNADATFEHVQDQVRSMVEAMRYRGPDASGVHVDEGLGAMGHARLSIIDTTDGANQPFFSSSGRTAIVFNGEIYNYVELRNELEQRYPFPFRTTSDTEVLLAAYEVWGDDCVNHFNGMWAFVVFDKLRKRVFCSRDRFGVKPFLYAYRDSRLYVASEAKAILCADDSFRTPNYRALSLLLRASVGGQNPETCFAGIFRLLPAHNLIVENDRIIIRRYWDYPEREPNRKCDVEAACDEFGGLLSNAVRLRMRSDVPVGFTLSGGLDSSAIVMLAAEAGFSGRKAYTATYRHESYRPDESTDAQHIADKAGMELVPVELTAQDLLPVMMQSVFHLEAPHAAMPILAYWKILERAKQDVTVLIEGQGADELLGGYTSTVAWPAIKDQVRSKELMQAMRLIVHGLAGAYGHSGLFFLLMMMRTQLNFRSLHRLFRATRGDEFVYCGPLRSERSDRFCVRELSKGGGDAVNIVLQYQHENGLVNLLQYGDAIPMAHSVEGRLPFMDFRLVEFVFRQSGELKIRDGYSKFLLRQAMRNLLPSQLVQNRSKRGFDTPVGKWFSENCESIVEPVLFSQACRQRGLFDLDRVKRLLLAHKCGRLNLVSQIYRWTVTELWFQRFIDVPQIAGPRV